MTRALWALLVLSLACSTARITRVRPYLRNLKGVTFFPYAGSNGDNFFDQDGRPCPGYDGGVRDSFGGWQADEGYICDHDTYEDGIRPAFLEMQFKGAIPSDGALDLIAGGYSIGAWGRVVARGSQFGDFIAVARVDLEFSSEHCKGRWSKEVGRTGVAGSALTAIRGRDFSGFTEIPDVRLEGCRAGDPAEVKLRLVGESNRGRIEVSAFGFSMVNRSELDQIFGLKSPGGS